MQFYIQNYICVPFFCSHRSGLLKKKSWIKSNASLETGIVYLLLCIRLLLSYFQVVTDLSSIFHKYLFAFFVYLLHGMKLFKDIFLKFFTNS